MTIQSIDPRVTELLDLAANEGKPLALHPDVIIGLEDRGVAVDPFTGTRASLAPRWLTARGLAVLQQLALVLLLVLAGLAPMPAQGKTCWLIAHGRVCYINGHFFSLRCYDGYRVDPPGSGHRCVK